MCSAGDPSHSLTPDISPTVPSLHQPTSVHPAIQKKILIQFKFSKIHHHINQLVTFFLDPTQMTEGGTEREGEGGGWGRGSLFRI